MTFGRQVGELDPFVALQVRRLLVGGRRLVVGLIEIRREKRKHLVEPALVISARPFRARRPSAAHRAEGHGAVFPIRLLDGIARLFGVRQGLFVDGLGCMVHVKADADMV